MKLYYTDIQLKEIHTLLTGSVCWCWIGLQGHALKTMQLKNHLTVVTKNQTNGHKWSESSIVQIMETQEKLSRRLIVFLFWKTVAQSTVDVQRTV